MAIGRRCAALFARGHENAASGDQSLAELLREAQERYARLRAEG